MAAEPSEMERWMGPHEWTKKDAALLVWRSGIRADDSNTELIDRLVAVARMILCRAEVAGQRAGLPR